MKKIFNYKFLAAAILLSGVLALGISCDKDRDGSPTIKPSQNPVITGFVVDSGSNGTVVFLQGSGLGSIASITFDKNGAPASLNPNLNTDNSLVFRVPDTAAGGRQSITVTNTLGKTAQAQFKVIALASVDAASAYSFAAGDEITLTGRFLDDVSSVVITGTTTPVTISSKTKTSLTIKFPATSDPTVKLTLTNASGVSNLTQEFVNADQAFVFFRDAYANGEGDASWGDAAAISSTEFISGTKSLGKKFAKGNWHNLGFGWNWIPKGPYNNLSFWIKGGLIDHDVWIFANSDGGPGHDQAQPAANKIVAKAGAWTYYKIPLSTLNLWADGTAANNFTINKFGFFLKGPDNADETLYVDDVMFIK